MAAPGYSGSGRYLEFSVYIDNIQELLAFHLYLNYCLLTAENVGWEAPPTGAPSRAPGVDEWRRPDPAGAPTRLSTLRRVPWRTPSSSTWSSSEAAPAATSPPSAPRSTI